MTHGNTGVAANGLTGYVRYWWQSKKVRTLLQIVFLIGMGAVAALAKTFDLEVGIPGHSAVFWLSVLVAGRAVVRKDGAGILMGSSMALWGLPMGMNNGFMYNLGLYGVTGLALDIVARLPWLNIRRIWGAALCGLGAHIVKFGFIIAAALTSGVAKHFLVVGVAQSFLLHVAFGATAGVVGWSAYRYLPRTMPGSKGK